MGVPSHQHNQSYHIHNGSTYDYVRLQLQDKVGTEIHSTKMQLAPRKRTAMWHVRVLLAEIALWLREPRPHLNWDPGLVTRGTREKGTAGKCLG